jgi:hypothetical protein
MSATLYVTFKKTPPYGDEGPELFALGSGLEVLTKARLPSLGPFVDWPENAGYPL